MSLSPFIGSTNENDATYTLTELEARDTGSKTKEELIRIATKEPTQHALTKQTPNANQTQTNTPITQTRANTEQQPTLIQEIQSNKESDTNDINNQTNDDTEENDEEDDDDEKYLPLEVVDQCLEWHKEYHDMRESLPKYRSDKRKVLTEAMKCAIKDESLPMLYTMCEYKIPDGAPVEEVINGVLCKCFHAIVEKAKHALGIISKKGSSNEGKKTYEEEIIRRKKSRDAGYNIATSIEKIENIKNEQLDEGVQQNRIDPIIDNIVTQAEQLSEDMQKAIFNTNEITRENVINTIEDIIAQGKQTNILTYIEHANNDIENMEETHKRKIKNCSD